jgi:3-dehydroquinate dehydratase
MAAKAWPTSRRPASRAVGTWDWRSNSARATAKANWSVGSRTRAAYTHTSVAILDALRAFDAPIIEVHITNIHQRDEFRRHSYVAMVARAAIAGCGPYGYELALDAAARMLVPADQAPHG